ncbi:unnamed protein product, partial [Thlaspi arvense]
ILASKRSVNRGYLHSNFLDAIEFGGAANLPLEVLNNYLKLYFRIVEMSCSEVVHQGEHLDMETSGS